MSSHFSSSQSVRHVSRRGFLAATAAGAVSTWAAPAAHTASKTDSEIIVGEGDFRYRVLHDWAQLPDRFTWQTTHNVAVDRDGFVYVIHEGHADRKDHPSIFVFDPEGRYVRSFGSQFQGGGHGLEVREEGSEQFLYVCAYQQVKSFAKLDLQGETVWQRWAPMESNLYAAGEDTNPQKIWGRDRFLPTNFAFLPDGDFLLADGYGSYFIHRYDREGQWKSCFGGPGPGEGTFDTPHGIWVDDRTPAEPQIVVADRAHHTLQWLTLDGKHQRTLTGFGLPANLDRREQLLLVPELYGRVSILDGENRIVARLGDDSSRIRNDERFAIRSDPSRWEPGRFVHPHDACFDNQGNIYVAEWVATGRVSKLLRLA